MKKILFVALAALGLSACNSEPKFKVEGEISGADGKMLYLEASALEGIVPLDSVKLKGNGTFAFKQVRPVSPEFYRLRVDDKVINFHRFYGNGSTGCTICGFFYGLYSRGVGK